MARLNNIGDSGSPCRRPLLMLIFLPNNSFTMICWYPLSIRFFTQHIHSAGKPLACNNCNKNFQFRESNALCMSAWNGPNFTFSFLASLIISGAYINVYEICLPFINPVCAGCTRSHINGCSLCGRTFETILCIPFIKLIGLKSLGSLASSLSDKRAIYELLVV